MPKNTVKNNNNKKASKKLRLGFFSDRKFKTFTGLSLLLGSIFLFISFISYFKNGPADQSVVESYLHASARASSTEVRNSLGIFGAIMAYYFIFLWFGVASLLIPPFLFLNSYRMLFKRSLLSTVKAFVFMVFYCIWISSVMGYYLLLQKGSSSVGLYTGGIGYELSEFGYDLLGWGFALLLLFLFVVFNMYFFNITRISGMTIIGNFLITVYEKIEDIIRSNVKKKEKIKKVEDISHVIDQVIQEVEEEENSKDESETWVVKKINIPKKKKSKEPDFTIDVPEKKSERKQTPTQKSEDRPIDPELSDKVSPINMSISSSYPIEEGSKEEQHTDQPIADEPDLIIEEPSFQEPVAQEVVNYDPSLDLPHYIFPSPHLLNEYPEKDVKVTKHELEQNKDKIIETLINFKIGISSIKATIGPTVTLYEIVPDAGVKISKIKNLEDDIALSLAALGIRIIAPIPGKGTIGIEVPNKNREMVDIKSVITTSKFMESKMELPVVLGKTISNEVFVTDLSKMPHLLMAGATGQGKSVGLNVILASLLYKKHPSQLKLVLVDPKKVELTLFNKIERHFLSMLPNEEDPIITDTSKVVNTLNSLCIEMDNRYDLLKDASCRNIKEYNKKFIERNLNPEKGHHHMPYIVLVIDELADLMMTAGKEVETPIARLAQLARAIGIHLIVATQRPSVNVITGVIKANFPARLSFRVTSKIDSRTILDAGGAEQLIGMGDMLLSSGSEITRLQCAFVDTPEIENICDFIGEQRGYASAYMLPEYVGDEESGIGEIDLSERDSRFAEAARLIVTHQQGSTSLIQRRMKLGYNRAGRIIDQLEAAGIVGAFEGSKAREVLIQDEHNLEQLLSDLENKN